MRLLRSGLFPGSSTFASLLLLPLALTASTYPPFGDDFPNPECGFYIAKGYDPGEHQIRQLDPALLRRARENGITLLNMSWVLSEFRDRPLSPDMLDRIRADFAAARASGIKVIGRFEYNSGPIGAPDAPLDRVLAHNSRARWRGPTPPLARPS
jgi:Domain of unknown function (DUF4874)